MPTKDRKAPPAKLYNQDLVQRVAPPHSYGIVLRCWHDAEDLPPPENHDPFLRTYRHGEVGVTFLPDHHEREVLSESELRLVDRTFVPGDICKRTVDDVRSGVVLKTSTRGRLAHVISGEEVPDWKTRNDVEESQVVVPGDFVAYDDWIGQVIEVFDELSVDVKSKGQVVSVPLLGSRMNVGDKGTDLSPTPTFTNLSSILGSVFGMRPGSDTVLEVRHTVYAISWLAINQSLDRTEAAKRQRPKKFWTWEDLSDLTLVQARTDNEMHAGDRVRLKGTAGAPVTLHGEEGKGLGILTVDTYTVTETESEIDVLWQDGVKETLSAKEVIPYPNMDDYDCWPGDYVMWKNEDEVKPAIVQSVNAVERTATVLLLDTKTTELVSVLELDPNGTSAPPPLGPHSTAEGLGVGRGEYVFIHEPGMTNGYDIPWVPKIGEVEPWWKDLSFEEGQWTGWRKELAELGSAIANRGTQEKLEEVRPKMPTLGDGSLPWFGEVTGFNLDGTIEVTHPDLTVKAYPLERLTKLQDGLELFEVEDMYDQEGNEQGHDGGEVWGDGGEWQTMDSEDGWEDDDEDDQDTSMDVDLEHTIGNGAAELDAMDIDVIGWGEPSGPGPSPPIISPSSPSQDSVWSELAEGAAVTNNIPNDGAGGTTHMAYTPTSTSPSSPSRHGIVQLPSQNGSTLTVSVANVESTPTVPGPSSLSKDCVFKGQTESSANITNGATSTNRVKESEVAEELSWKRFDILPCAPVDHAYYSSPPAQPAKSFLNRLNREYRALANSLPDTIVVRAYEDRTDLLRSLIIGPENTPYGDAPFVIDWMLDSNFPNSPPIAHFLSWTNGNGRVNPNLYEEGKVCLSILGTWAGDRNETWSAARSSLLQALVSIQGLVLVKEPWFCEPAYEKLRGTEEGTVNSRLYSEKAYVLSRGFVRRALEIPLGSLEEEINWLYYTHGRLHKVLNDSRGLIERSRKDPNPSREELEQEGMADAAVPRLTAGGIITLERTLGKLQGLLHTHHSKGN
ncbi:hypothetical protein P691DRAFT_691418 [Macrolepiota fuliginosa MF-IS2]|uniref:UBC core domain-containing protein n=1 Tax=Macrolepiota fuliginosa MF-IS2 TaxID=1400762 RepID=A0A9P5XQU9_9AGAR|nr:hypothetical protein P691DRAFT_691418 [Macrolepiota fuliginosa MF-IS2]